MSISRIILNIKLRRNRFYSALFLLAKGMQQFRVPHIRPVAGVLYHLRDASIVAWGWLKSKFYCEQLVRYRCKVGDHLTMDGYVPYIYGYGKIEIGHHVRIGNRNTWVVGIKVHNDPILQIGNYTTLGYMNLISVAKKVVIGDHCLLAGEVKIFDNNSHSLDPQKRRERTILDQSDVSPVTIEDDVWIGTNALIMKGVTIGRGAVVAAGSVVTNSVAPYTVVGGNPARVIKVIEPYYSQLASSPEGQRDGVSSG